MSAKLQAYEDVKEEKAMQLMKAVTAARRMAHIRLEEYEIKASQLRTRSLRRGRKSDRAKKRKSSNSSGVDGGGKAGSGGSKRLASSSAMAKRPRT